MVRIDGPRHRFHEAEDAWNLVVSTLKFDLSRDVQPVDSALEVNEHVVHIDVEDLPHGTPICGLLEPKVSMQWIRARTARA